MPPNPPPQRKRFSPSRKRSANRPALTPIEKIPPLTSAGFFCTPSGNDPHEHGTGCSCRIVSLLTVLAPRAGRFPACPSEAPASWRCAATRSSQVLPAHDGEAMLRRLTALTRRAGRFPARPSKPGRLRRPVARYADDFEGLQAPKIVRRVRRWTGARAPAVYNFRCDTAGARVCLLLNAYLAKRKLVTQVFKRKIIFPRFMVRCQQFRFLRFFSEKSRLVRFAPGPVRKAARPVQLIWHLAEGRLG